MWTIYGPGRVPSSTAVRQVAGRAADTSHLYVCRGWSLFKDVCTCVCVVVEVGATRPAGQGRGHGDRSGGHRHRARTAGAGKGGRPRTRPAGAPRLPRSETDCQSAVPRSRDHSAFMFTASRATVKKPSLSIQTKALLMCDWDWKGLGNEAKPNAQRAGSYIVFLHAEITPKSSQTSGS